MGLEIYKDIFCYNKLTPGDVDNIPELDKAATVFVFHEEGDEVLPADKLSKNGATVHQVKFNSLEPNEDDYNKYTSDIDVAKRPVLLCSVRCGAAAVGLGYAAPRTNMPQDEVVSTANEMGFHAEVCEDLYDFTYSFVEKKLNRIRGLKDCTEFAPGVWIGPQLSEESLVKFIQEKGIKAVVNLRHSEEKGLVGLGVFPREDSVVGEAGAEYFNCMMKRNGPKDQKAIDAAAAQLEKCSRPVFVHCVSGIRAGQVVQHMSDMGTLK
eukprot:GFYU01008207.1.p1 GENE.GFYU01008207.1~~GFYU01008207.1.p1  ORF type:complete len:294 (+),score=76.49 GFYU01008207.1:85-882(+)